MTPCIQDQPLPHDAGLAPRPRLGAPEGRRLMAGSWQPPAAAAVPRLRVLALGPLRVERDGLPLQHGSKPPRKPLELLTLLVAHGCRPLDTGTVMDELWPSLDAEAPRAALDMAVMRLRRLLGAADAVLLTEGQVRLNPQTVWSDVAAFESLAEAAAEGSERAPWQALSLYQDALLGSGPVGARLLARRQRLAQQLCDLALDAARRLMACNAEAAAARLLQRALACEPLCEPLYRELMRAQLAQGERAEALRTHARCTQLLRTALAVAPSRATEALAEAAAGVLQA